MTLVQRAAALMLALVVSTLPLALERCRMACVQASASQAPEETAHACHDTADAEDGPSLAPSPRACGHGDEARTASLNAVGSTVRHDLAVAAPPIVTSFSLTALTYGAGPVRPPDLSSVTAPRNLPLRL